MQHPFESFATWRDERERSACGELPYCCVDEYEKSDCLIALNAACGVDPVLAAAEGRQDEIPFAGWLVEAYVAMGYQGDIDIYRYAAGGFIAERARATNSGMTYLECKLRASEYRLAYVNPGYGREYLYPDCWSTAEYFSYPENPAGVDCTSLENGGWLLDTAAVLEYASDRHSLEHNSHMLQAHRSRTPINRAVGSLEEVGAVLTNLAAGMSLGENDARTLVETAGRKLSVLSKS
ncbi:hypothetical protein F4X86_01355 [Candidatus Saccharibacteria bacterium]|nr:hypothetical protein [Candidatus Saccharibacteria bacterium]